MNLLRFKFLLLLALLASLGPAAASVAPVTDYSFTGGLKEPNSATLDVSVQGTVATLLDEQGLQFVDVADKYAPVTMGEFVSDPVTGALGLCSDFTRVGNLVFVAAGLQGLSIVNAADPELPVEVRRRRFPFIRPDDTVGYASALSVAVSGNYCYAGTVSHGVKILDISNPANAAVVATFAVIDPAIGLTRASYDLAVKGNLLFIANHLQGLRIVDITNPLVPTQISLTSFGSARAYSLQLNGDILYVGTQENGLRVYNVANPVSPVLLGIVSLPGDGPGTLSLDGNRLLAATFSGGIAVLDVTNPAAPVVKGRSPVDMETDSFGFLSYGAEGAVSAGGYLYAALGRENLRIFKDEGASSFARLGGLPGGFSEGAAVDVRCTATHAFVAQGAQGIRSLSLANPAAPQIVNTLATTGVTAALSMNGNTLYAAMGRTGLAVVDVTNPASLSLLGSFDPDGNGTASSPGDAKGVLVNGSTVYLANGAPGFSILNAANPAAITVTGSVDTTGDATGFARQGTTLYVADGAIVRTAGGTPVSGGLLAYDISDPAAPLGVYSNLADLQDAGELFIPLPGLLCVGDRAAGQLVFFDITLPEFPVLVERLSLGAPPVSMAIRDNNLYVGLGGAGVVLVDLTNPRLPVRKAGYQLTGGEGVALSGNLICLAAGNQSFQDATPENFAVLQYTPPAPAAAFLGNPRMVGNQCVMDFTAPAGTTLHLAKSTDLVVWNVLRPVTGTGTTTQESDPLPPNPAKVYYRLQTIP